ncbi:MAG: hypothetical protein WA418_21190, partial [Bradyrhizobium sp.]
DHLRNAQAAAPVASDHPAATRAQAAPAADPAAALIETLRAHAARQPAYEQGNAIAAAEPAARPQEYAAADDTELDDPAAALINLLQSRFALPEDEFEADPSHEDSDGFEPEAPEAGVFMQDDPAARLISLLESRSSLPAEPPIVQAPQQQRPLFVPGPFEDPASPPLDFIPRPPALRPRPRNIQHDESLDGIQDILARLGRRA